MAGKHRDRSQDEPGDKSFPVGNRDDVKRRTGSSRNDTGKHHANKGKDEPRDKR
jgi:hypothetical protein